MTKTFAVIERFTCATKRRHATPFVGQAEIGFDVNASKSPVNTEDFNWQLWLRNV